MSKKKNLEQEVLISETEACKRRKSFKKQQARKQVER